MLFNSVSFAVFIVAAFILYYLVPHKYRWVFLLAASYGFYKNFEERGRHFKQLIKNIQYITGNHQKEGSNDR